MPRIPLFSAENMTPEQERVYHAIVSGPRTTVVGPLRASMHHPELADRWQKFGELLRFDTTLPRDLNELAILVTARRWNAELEWAIHEKAALEAGLDADLIESIRLGHPPHLPESDEADVYEFTRTLVQHGNVDEEVYQRVWTRWGTVGIVELSSVIGYYSMVAMTLNVHEIPLPAGTQPPLPALNPSTELPSLTSLPAAATHDLSGAGRGHA
ncbi:MAG: carboxymuconolactone decarboxylase family protein [Hyphomicrobiales bacterium]|nr:MAG: carboxymuconolactone decarboxylase family protein [Hyphomicrobiales bacterium]